MKKLFALALLLGVSFVALGQTKLLRANEYVKTGDSLNKIDQYKSALEYYKKALVVLKKSSEKNNDYYLTGIKMGYCYWSLSEYDKTLQLTDNLQKELALRASKSYNLKGKLYALSGKTYQRKGKYATAKQHLKQALKLFTPKTNADYREMVSLYTFVGRVYWTEDAFAQQLECYQKALTIAKQHLGEKHLYTARAYDNLGFYYSYAQPAYKKALKYYQVALDIKRKLLKGDNHLTIATSCYRIGVVFGRKGNYEVDLKYKKKALAIRKKVLGEQHLLVGRVYGALGYLYMELEAYDIALSYNEKYLAILRSKLGDDHLDLFYAYANLTALFTHTKKFEQALYYAWKNVSLLKEKSVSITKLVSVYQVIGNIYLAKGDYQKAIHYYEKGQESLKKEASKFQRYLANMYTNLGRGYAGVNNLSLALNYFKMATDLRKKFMGGKSIIVAYNLLHLAKTYLAQKKYLKATQTIQQALVQAVYNFNDSTNILKSPAMVNITQPFTFRITAFKARSAFLLYKKTQDIKHLKLALQVYELSYLLFKKLQKSFSKSSDKITFNETLLQLQQGAMQAYWTMYKKTGEEKYLEQMFGFSELVKANTLKNSLDNQKALKFANIPVALTKQEKELRLEITFWQKQVASKPKKAAQYQDSLFKYNRAYEKLITRLEKSYPKYTQLKHQNKTVSLTQVQQKLNTQTALLEYAFGNENSYLFVITKTQVKILPIANNKKLRPLLNQYYNALSGEARLKKFAAVSYQLYQVLLKPAEKYIKDKKHLLVIAPSLESIPFEAFIRQKASKAIITSEDFSQLKYLINQYQVSYHYSATLWFQGAENVRKITPRLLAFAPFSTGESKAIDTRSRGSADPLPESGVEVKAIFNLFNLRNKEAQIFLAKTATKERFIKKVQNYNMVHIASHSKADIRNASLAKVRFAPTKSNLPDDLLASEIYNLELNADLLVLSSCESGVGKLAKGEGVLSLARSFLYAGARNIVFSLWEVNDTYTRKLMVAFYKALLSGKSYRAALQTAQQTNLHADKTLHPKHWAGFVMIGE